MKAKEISLSILILCLFLISKSFSQTLTIQETIDYINKIGTCNEKAKVYKVTLNDNGSLEFEYGSSNLSDLNSEGILYNDNSHLIIIPCKSGNCFLSTNALGSGSLSKAMYSTCWTLSNDEKEKLIKAYSYLIKKFNESNVNQTKNDPFATTTDTTFKDTITTSIINKADTIKSKSNYKIPLVKVGNRYKLKVSLNDNNKMSFDFILDTGADEVLVSSDIFMTFYKGGLIKDADIKNLAQYSIADGSIVTGLSFTLKKLQIGNVVLTNIAATVIEGSDECLLGGSLLNQFGKYTIDTVNSQLILGK